VNLAALIAATAAAPSPGSLQGLRRRLEPFERQGLLRVEGDRWRLSDPAGLALSNAVLRELLDWWQTERERAQGVPVAAP
jgi:oxygen-independent coproporphyrinogen-3 oxidase